MTTIAVDILNKKIASDSIVSGGAVGYSTPKIFKAKDGSLFAFCGSLTSCLKFKKWMMAGRPSREPLFKEDDYFEGVSVERGGVFTWDSSLIPGEVFDGQFFTMGSGAQFAMAALHCGKTLQESIELAIKLDPGSTGGRIQVMEYQPACRKRRAAKA